MNRPRLHDDGYLAFLRQKFCTACGRGPRCEAAHVRINFFAMSKKPDDRFAVPLCPSCHREQHSQNEAAFWAARGLDPFAIAATLYAEYGGDGGHAKKKRKPRNTIRPKGFGPKRKISQGKTSWPKRRFASNTRKS